MSSHKSTAGGGSTRKRDRVDVGQNSSKRQKFIASEHLQNLCFIAMMWSPENMLAYYSSSVEEEQSFISKLSQCAKKYRRHNNDFVPEANLVLWLKHCARVSAIKESQAAHGDVLGSDLRLEVEDLVHLIALDQTEPAMVYGSAITMATAGEYQQIIREWTESLDGRVKMRGETFNLRSLQPLLWNTLLLEFNGAGLLRRRDGRNPAIVTQQVENHSTARPAPDSKRDSIEHASGLGCTTPLEAPV